MLSMSYAGKNVYFASKTSGVLRVGASGANGCYVLVHCGAPPSIDSSFQDKNPESSKQDNFPAHTLLLKHLYRQKVVNILR